MARWTRPSRPAKYFTWDEVRCRATGDLPPERVLASGAFWLICQLADHAREALDKPLVVNSWYRSPKHPVEAEKKEPGVHSLGLAIDFGVAGLDAARLLRAVMRFDPAHPYIPLERYRHGIFGIGVAQKGERRSRYVHVDVGILRSRHALTRPAIWTY